MQSHSYKSAYLCAEKAYKGSTASAARLAAAYRMALAAGEYQEDAYETSTARYRELLPALEPLERALCHAFLGEYDSALADEAALKATAVERIADYCEGGRTLNVTPTAFDVLALAAQDRGSLQPRERADLQRRLVDFHTGDNDDVYLWHLLRWLDLREQVPNHEVPEAELRQLAEKWQGSHSPYVAQLYSRLARRCNAGQRYAEAVAYCERGIAHDAKSEGGVACANLKAEIEQTRIEVAESGLTVMPGRHSLQGIRYRNAGHLWLRVVKGELESVRHGEQSAMKTHLLKRTPVAQVDVELPATDRYCYGSTLVSLPPLEAGRYVLMVSPTADFKQGFEACDLHCTEMHLVYSNGQVQLADRRSGQPITGQRMEVVREEYGKEPVVRGVATTDADGRHRFGLEGSNWRDRLVVERAGYRLSIPFPGRERSRAATETTKVKIMHDRPVYRPGETVQASLLLYTTDGLEAEAVSGRSFTVSLYDPNGEVVAADTVKSNSHGLASVSFLLPKDRLPGLYIIRTPFGTCAVGVEEYKQPTFMVSLSAADGKAPAFGSEATVEGLAVGYNGVAVADGRVQYKVLRRQLARKWWWIPRAEAESVMAVGECRTAADGTFAVHFVPEPDSNVELSGKPVFEYVVEADVTDLAGESHWARTSFRVGFVNAFLALEASSTPSDLKVRHFDLNGNDLPGQVAVKVERLQMPAVPKLDCPMADKEVRHTLSKDEFERRFPLWAYEADYNNPDAWQGREVADRTVAGVYRITLSAADADTAVEYRTVVPPQARKVPATELLWAEVDKPKAEVGEVVRLRMGSRFPDVHVYYSLMLGDEELDFRHLELDDEIKHIDIAVDKAMLGGFSIRLMTVKEGVSSRWEKNVEVPFSHKELKVEIATFRDRLLPGEHEQWTLKVSGTKAGETAAVVLGMYDDALNIYDYNYSWDLAPWRHNYSPYPTTWQTNHIIFNWLDEHRSIPFKGTYPTVWNLKEALHRYGRLRGRYMRMAKSANGIAMPTAAVEFLMVQESDKMEEVAYDEVASIDIGTAVDGGIGGADEPQVRTNLNTLAFFAPCILTDADGMATYSFTVPELLTRWNVRGLAVTRDIKMGGLNRTLVTSKPLMVQPNVPRFLRSGDRMEWMAKVVANDPEAVGKTVEVSFKLTDAASGSEICRERQTVVLTGTSQVRFEFVVPQDIHVATYRIVAGAEGMSDGEQGQVAVVGNRGTVTVSRALFINGVGEKRFRMDEWLQESDTRHAELVGAEVVSDPVWLAVKALPCIKQYDSPSLVYVASQLYVNNLGQDIVEHYIAPEALEALAEGGESRLSMNEDIKQTLLKNSPWVADARGEAEQMVEVKRFLDGERMAAEGIRLRAKLMASQNSDGGWGWMPEGRSNLWATQRILALIAADASLQGSPMVSRAVEYIDREQQHHYEIHIKPYLKKGYRWQPVDVNYLYVRSLYGKASTEAYGFYYKNAQRSYTDCDHLYTQAQLALIFERSGDRKRALEIVRRLKEKSLENEEMGLYWRDNTSGWFWYERPIETQAMLIRAFAAADPTDSIAVGQMQQWLLKQKQTTHWGNEVSTVDAVSALMVGRREKGLHRAGADDVSLTVFGEAMEATGRGAEGYKAARWTGEALGRLQQKGNADIVVDKRSKGIAWGAVYYQFTDDMDRVPHSESGITLRRTYLAEEPLHVGDRVKVRIDIHCDRAMDYLEISDGRPACAEPLSTHSGWHWNDGLSYYMAVDGVSTHCYVEHIDNGDYYLEYQVYITNPGTFLTGTVSAQCMYAPEFRAVAPAQRLEVEK